MANGSVLQFIVEALDKSGPGLDSASQQIESSANKWQGVMVGASAAIAAAWGAINLSATIADSMDISAANAKLSAQLGAVGADSATLGQVAGQVWAEGFTGSMDEVNVGIAAVRRNLGDLNEADLTQASTQVMALAQMSDESANKIAAAAGKMVKTGLAKDWQEALDIITRGLQSNANEAEDLLDTFQEYSTEFRQLGLSGAQSLGLMNQALAAGARNGDVVADALKEFAIRGQTAVTLSASQIAAAHDKARSAAEALVRAQDAVKSSGQSLARAQESERSAQEAVNAARKEAAQDLADMQDQLDSANFDTRGAELSLSRAQQRMAQVMADSSSSTLDRAEAAYGVEQAQRALAEQQKKVNELAEAKDAADRKGVNGSDKVKAAQKSATEAHDATTSAVKAYRQAQVDAETASRSYAAAQAATRQTLTAEGQAFERLGIDATSAQQAIAKGGPGATAVLQQVLDGLRRVKDPAERSALAVTLFGTKAEDMQQALYALDPKKAATEFGNFAGAAKQATDAISGTPKAQVDAMRNKVDLFKASLINTQGPLGGVATFIGAFGGDLGGLAMAIVPLLTIIPSFGVASAGAAGGIGALAASIWATTWPILLVIGLIALLIGAVVLIVQNWGPISEWFLGLWDGISKGASDAWGGITKWWSGVMDGIGAVAGKVWDGIKLAWDWSPYGLVINNWGKIMDFLGGVATSIGKAFVQAFRWVAMTWNATLGALSWSVPSWIPFVGGQTWSVPKMPVPALASGGIVTKPTLALIGEAGDEAVVPLDRYDGGGGDRVIVLQVDGRELARVVDRENTRRR